jgi:hypothetical protein
MQGKKMKRNLENITRTIGIRTGKQNRRMTAVPVAGAGWLKILVNH